MLCILQSEVIVIIYHRRSSSRPTMLKQVWRVSSVVPGRVSQRLLSQQASKSVAKVESPSGKENQLWPKRKHTYDQIFEYQIDEKPHLKSKPVSSSFISPDFKIFLHRKYDFSWAAFKRLLDRYIHKRETTAQQYLTRRHGILGALLINLT